MKDKILVFIIGLLVGAIITAAGFLVYQKVSQNNNQMPGGNGMKMMEQFDGQTPPDMPNGSDNGNRQAPPSMNNSSNSNSSTKNKTI